MLITFKIQIFAFVLGSFAINSSAFAEPIDLISLPIKHFNLSGTAKISDRIEYLGGLELRSSNSEFGGLSGLRVTNGGTQLFAIGDKAKWFTASIKRNQNGKIKSLSSNDLSCVCQIGGKPYKGKWRGDAEGLEISGNRAYISFEGVNRINGYDLKGRVLGEPAQVTPNFRKYKISGSLGLEALALAPIGIPLAGKFIAITEDFKNSKGNHRAFIATKNDIEEFSISASDDYRITDATFLKNGKLLILERRAGLTIGVGMRIREFDGSKIKTGSKLTGTVLMEAGITSQIDNMEGLSAWENQKGETILSLISDDNFNRFQRTIYLEFKLTN